MAFSIKSPNFQVLETNSKPLKTLGKQTKICRSNTTQIETNLLELSISKVFTQGLSGYQFPIQDSNFFIFIKRSPPKNNKKSDCHYSELLIKGLIPNNLSSFEYILYINSNPAYVFLRETPLGITRDFRVWQ